MTLSEKQRRGISLDRDICLRGVERGVSHLHKLGLVHNDPSPANIMIAADNACVIDFDSCKRLGEKLGGKGATKDWAMDGVTHARSENDFYGISKIRDLLKKKIDT